MKSFFFHLIGASILVQPVDVLAFDFTDLDAFCQELEKVELEAVKIKIAEGYLTEEEAAEENQNMPDIEQCVCYFQKMLDGVGADYTVHIQKFALESYTVEELGQLEEPEYPDGLDMNEFLESSAIACGFEIE